MVLHISVETGTSAERLPIYRTLETELRFDQETRQVIISSAVEMSRGDFVECKEAKASAANRRVM